MSISSLIRRAAKRLQFSGVAASPSLGRAAEWVRFSQAVMGSLVRPAVAWLSLHQPKRLEDNAAPSKEPLPSFRGPIVAGVAVAFVFFAVLGAWAALAPLNSAAIAPGVLSVESQRKTIQHLEGGIVSSIHVADGDHVQAGQVLIRLDDTQPRVNLKLFRGRFLAAQTLEARLIAMRDGLPAIVFPEALLKADPAEADPVMAGQVTIFNAKKKSLENEKGILERRIAAIQDEIAGLEGQVEAEDRQLLLIASELKGLKDLHRKGLVTGDRILALERAAAEIEGNRSRDIAGIARAKQTITETQLNIDQLFTRMMNDVVAELRETQKEIFDLAQRMVAIKDVLSRTEIRAPLAGIVVAMRVHSARGVVAPGAPLLDIVPEGERLIVEAQISPADIDVVHAGLPAEVQFTGIKSGYSAPVMGTVQSVSADRLTDERTGATYFLARVEIDDAFDGPIDGARLTPGMPAQVMIVTGRRTTLGYLVAPLTQSFARALREE